ncbi:hypothetical protein [Parvularcula lutaonensis]|uniref:Uncharacterized protein n=1 Tax=Parvularcula lutaonensis TaxID=491923 RepID=A0ABV7MAQ4_9PROT|nr:hypothetical protein [Parvularcula lutaonensis]
MLYVFASAAGAAHQHAGDEHLPGNKQECLACAIGSLGDDPVLPADEAELPLPALTRDAPERADESTAGRRARQNVQPRAPPAA